MEELTLKDVEGLFKDQFSKKLHITISYDDINNSILKKFSKEIAVVKTAEHGITTGDTYNEYGRFFSGMMGELAAEVAFDIEFVDTSVGASRKYNYADLLPAGYNIGIKTCTYGYFVPFVKTDPQNDEIIIVRNNKKRELYIMGIATVDVMREHQQRSLLTMPNVASYKSGFGRYDLLKPISKEILEEYKLSDAA